MDELPDDSDRDENGVHLVRRHHVCEEPVRIGGSGRLLPETQVMLDTAKAKSIDSLGSSCWNAPRGAVCRDGVHTLRGGFGHELCQRRAVEVAIRTHEALLAECKFTSHSGPVAEPLLAALEPDRPVRVEAGGAVLRGQELAAVLRGELELVPRRHALRHGQRGAGKTHHALIERFWCLERGIASIWLTEPTFMEIVSQKESTDPAERARGQARWATLVRARVVFLDDLCLDDNPPRQKQPGRPLLQVPLVQLQGEMLGVLRATTNRSLEELNAHPDCGGRALSRLLAVHKGEPALVSHYAGEDQRIWESVRARQEQPVRAAGVGR